MEFLNGGIRRLDVKNAEIFAGPVDGLQGQGLLPDPLPARCGSYAVVVYQYYPATQKTPLFFRTMDEAAVCMSDLRQLSRNRQRIDAYRAAGVQVLDQVPDGWTRQQGTTAPEGFAWYSNGRSHFDGSRRCALIREEAGRHAAD